MRSAITIIEKVTPAARRLDGARASHGRLASLADGAAAAEAAWWAVSACVDALRDAHSHAQRLAGRAAARPDAPATDLGSGISQAELRRALVEARNTPALQDARLLRLCRWARVWGGLRILSGWGNGFGSAQER